jgi:SPP1 gp7 family putative phage head morphogenesis protein
MTSVLTRLAAEVGDELFSIFNPEGAFNVRDPGVQRAIARRVTKVVGINTTTADRIRSTLTDGEMAGEGIDKLARRVRGVFSEASTTRARTIARTEVIGATNESQLAAAKQSGVSTTKQWLAAHDSRTRPSHGSADGQTVAVDQPFIVGGSSLMHPGDSSGPARETINCRCTQIFGTATDALGAGTSLIEPTAPPTEFGMDEV